MNMIVRISGMAAFYRGGESFAAHNGINEVTG
jgi:hypothetical protein